MKKLLVLIMSLTLSLSLAACGGKDTNAPAQGSTVKTETAASDQGKAEFVTRAFGDITMSVPSVFNDVTENQGVYVSGGPDSSIVVTPAMEIDILPSEWDKSVAEGVLEPLYGSTYTDIKLSAFEGDVNMNGNTAVYLAFYGKNASGKDRLVQVVRLFNGDNTSQYVITFMHSDEDKFFTPEVAGKIINSITLGKK